MTFASIPAHSWAREYERDPIAIEEAFVSCERSEVTLDIGAVNLAIGHDIVERIHELPFGEDRQLGQWPVLEPAMKALIER